MRLLNETKGIEDDGRSFDKRSMKDSRKVLRRRKKLDKKKAALMKKERDGRRAKLSRPMPQEPEESSDEESDESERELSDQYQEEAEGDVEEEEKQDVTGAHAEEASRAPSRYVPPQLRRAQTQAAASSSKFASSIRSLLNKVAEGTLSQTAARLSRLVEMHSRAEVATAVSECMVQDTARDATTAVTHKLVAVYAAVVGLLYHEYQMGLLLPATLVEALVVRFEELRTADDVRGCVNVALFVGYLYHFNMVNVDLVAELGSRLVESAELGPLEVEVLLTIAQLAGPRLRRDAPGQLGALLERVRERTEGASGELTLRTRFMLETLTNLSHNRTLPADPHLEQLDRALKTQRAGSAAPRQLAPLRAAWSELLEARSTNRRWWLQAGAEGVGRELREVAGGRSDGMAAQSATLSPELAALARKMRINTDLRRRVFGIVMTAEGYADAAEKISRLKLQGKADRDVVFVVVECCTAESQYNMYYALIMSRLCQASRSYPLSLQYHLWDQIRELERFSESAQLNLAFFVRDLLAHNSISLRVLKPVDFLGNIPKALSSFVNTLMSSLLSDTNLAADEQLYYIFSGLASVQSEDTKLLREGVLLFVRFSLAFRKEQVTNKARLKARLGIAKQALQEVRKKKGGNDEDLYS